MTARTTLFLFSSLFALLVVAFSPVSARAESATSYRPAMRALVGTIDAWIVELDVQLAAVNTKPEAACSEEYAVLVSRGATMVDDLRGTALNAPAALVGANVLAADGLGAIVTGAAEMSAGCNGGSVANSLSRVEDGRADYAQGMMKIRNFLTGLRLR